MDTGFTRVITQIQENKTLKILVAFLELIRIRNCLIAFFGVLVGALLVYPPGGEHLKAKMYLAATAAAIITGGGNALNDYFDHLIDRTNKPTRPIPSGRVQRSDVFMLSVGLLLMGLGISKSINKYCLIIATVNTLMLVVYALYSKKMFFISNIGISYLVASVFIFGAFSTIKAGDNLDSERFTFLAILTACAFFMTLSREIIKDIEDVEGDKRMYSKTLPIVLGQKTAKNIAVFFATTAILLSLTPLTLKLHTINPKVYGILITISDLTFISALTMLPSLAQKMMVFGMTLSLLAFFLAKTLA